MTSSTLTRKVGLAAAIMMASVFLSRVIGLVREMVIAGVAGAGASVDAYQVGFIVPEILNHVVATGFLSITFIPIFGSYLVRGEEDKGWEIFSVILTCFGSLLLLATAAAFVWAPELVSLVAPRLDDPTTRAAAIRMTRIIMPAQLMFFAGGLLMAVQFAKERFAIPALAPLIYNLGIITGGLVLGPRLGMEGFAWGVLAGAFVGNFALQLYGARKLGLRFRPSFDFTHPDLKRYVLLTLPLMLGLTMSFSTEFLTRFFGSWLEEGSIAALNYALRVMFILVGLFGQAAGVASYPFLAGLAVQGKLDELNRLLNDTLRRYIGLVLPFSALLMVLRHEVVLLLFQRGRFDAAATDLTSDALLFILVGAFAFAAQSVVTRAYYATGSTLFPSLFSTLAVMLSLPVYWFGLRLWKVQGVALGVSVAVILEVSLLFALWNRRSRNAGGRAVYGFFARAIGLSVVVGLCLELLRRTLLSVFEVMSFTGGLLMCVVVGLIFLVLVAAGARLLRLHELSDGARAIVRKLARS